jgi:hypothetical protein
MGGRVLPVRITLPDGTVVTNEQADLERVLSRAFEREVVFEVAHRDDRSAAATAEEYWPDMPGLDYRDTVTSATPGLRGHRRVRRRLPAGRR